MNHAYHSDSRGHRAHAWLPGCTAHLKARRVGCVDDVKGRPASAGSTAQPKSDHGNETALGRATIAGIEFDVSALGAIPAGSDAAVAVKVVNAPAGKDWRTLNVYLWVEDAAGKKLSPPEKGRVEDGRLHGHASIPAQTTEVPAKVVIRVRDGDTDARGFVPLKTAGAAEAKPGHTHEKTAHDGVMTRLRTAAGADAGWIEVKLHDDKGDLELWMTTDKSGKVALDLPADATITTTFVDHARRVVKFAPRDTDQNPGEDGKPNMRDGKTNYFIFPGKTGADSAWLIGKSFQSIAFVEVEAGGQKMRSEELVIRPHSHH